MILNVALKIIQMIFFWGHLIFYRVFVNHRTSGLGG